MVPSQYNDGLGNLTDVIDVGGAQWHFTYDASHRLTVMKDPKCLATTGCPGVQNHYDGSAVEVGRRGQLARGVEGNRYPEPGGRSSKCVPLVG